MSVFENEKPEAFHFLRLSLSLDWGLFLPPTKAKSAKGHAQQGQSRSCIRHVAAITVSTVPMITHLDFAKESLLYRLSDKRSASNNPVVIGEAMLFRCTNLKRSDFDPITEIIRNLFRFHFWGTNNIGNAKEFRQILQALNWPGAKPFSQKTRIQQTLRGAREATFRQ